MIAAGSDATTTTDSAGIVFIVDDDASVRRGLSNLFRSAGFTVEAFGSAAEMERSPYLDSANCLVLDVRLPTLNGMDLQEQLASASRQFPIIFITGYADVPMTIRAMRGGAIDFFTKPVDGPAILEAVSVAIRRDRERRATEQNLADVLAKFRTLTPRESQIMELVTAGLMNKQVAAETQLSEITVKIHRGNIMRKMGAKSFADLVRMADAIKARSSRS